MMQQPTCIGLRVRTPSDAHVIFHAVHVGILRMVPRRLDTDERRAISSGCVYVWEERGPTAEATGLGIERWTDSIQWGPSRVRDEFLFYAEKRAAPVDTDTTTSDSSDTGIQRRRHFRQPLTKQTYSVYVETSLGRKKWHLIAYFVPEIIDQLQTIDDHPLLATLRVPRGIYTSARSSKNSRPPYPAGGISPLVSESQHEPVGWPRSGASGQPTGSAATLAPLAYLKRLPPRPRHVLDEMALMSFSGTIGSENFYRSHM